VRGKARTFIVVVIFLCSSLSSYGIEFHLKLFGGLNYSSLRDINLVLAAWKMQHEKEAQVTHGYEFEGGDVKKFHKGFDFEAELLAFLSNRLALGIGTGFIYNELLDQKTALTIKKNVTTYVYVHPATVSAFPLSLSGYYFLPLGKKFSLYLRGGVGLLWAKYVDRDGVRRIQDTKYSYSSQLATAKNTFFHGGLGFKYQLEPSISFFLEASGKAAKIDNFKGDLKGEIGTLFFFEEYNPKTQFWQAKIQLKTEEPNGAFYRSVRKALVDFSGVSAKMGLMIKF
jgi:opacity protein-like surface antigen